MGKKKLFISLILVVAVISILSIFQATRSTSSEVLTPSSIGDLATKNPSLSLARIRVGGRVTKELVNYKVSPEFLLTFSIASREQEDGQSLKVRYRGIKPDMFESGRDVLIDGDFKNGMLEAHTLLTQCPSKYEPPSPLDMVKANNS